MKTILLSIALIASMTTFVSAEEQTINVIKKADGKFGVEFKHSSGHIIGSPTEGLWSVSTDWENDWMDNWVHSAPTMQKQFDGWTILSGDMLIHDGVMAITDSYKEIRPNLIKCVRRYHWKGQETLNQANLSVRMQMKGNDILPFMPGIVYYGNPAGAKVNPNIIATYKGEEGEFAIFEEHRYSMPFVMLENAKENFGAAIHVTPSPVRGAVLQDQWWSLGSETKEGVTEFVMYTGPIGYNKQHSVAKARQHTTMRYTDAYINMEPGRIIEKEFYIELFDVKKKGSGFQIPIYTSLDLFKPYDADQFTKFEDIVRSKVRFAESRWLDENGAVGYNMYEHAAGKNIVMGWCGQAGSPGYAMQWLNKYSDDPDYKNKIQGSLDYLTNYPINEDGVFQVGQNVSDKNFFGGDHVSCGQAMYNFAKAIESAGRKYNTSKWKKFLKEVCDLQSERILKSDWRPYSTAESFYIAPLAIAAKLFKNKTYKEAALKAADTFAERHLSMEEPYWGGTLDATCEDKEGAWAAFQGFLEVYERFGDKKYLEYAKHAMDVCLSYVVVWDIPLPSGRLADHNFKSTGWTIVSPQNQHLDVYGVLFTPEVYKMGVHLKDERLKKMAKVMYRTCFQLTDAYGSQGEQVQQTNFAQHGDMSNVYKLRGGYSESWTVFWITAHFINAAARFEEMGVEL